MKYALRLLAYYAVLIIIMHFLPHDAKPLVLAMGLPLPAGGVLTQQMMQGLATWDGGAWSTFAVVGNFVLTPLQMLNGSTTYLTLTGAAGAANATTPSALALFNQFLAAYGVPPAVGESWTFEVNNTTNGTVTMVAGTGVTINGTATIATTVNRTYFCTFTATGPTPTVTMQNVASRNN